MVTKDQKISLKSLQAEIVTLRKELFTNNKMLGEIKEALKKANDEIDQLKDMKNQEERGPVAVPNCGPGIRVKCKFCDDRFDKNSDLEVHIKAHHNTVETFKCDQCGKSFVLEWRLRKHQGIHKEGKIKKCHYFNNQKNCPFEELGCMFEHSFSGICKYGAKCTKIMCPFEHNSKN